MYIYIHLFYPFLFFNFLMFYALEPTPIPIPQVSLHFVLH